MTKHELTKREKVLILIAILLLLTYLVVQFAIYPLFNRYFDDIAERNSLQTEKVQVETKIANSTRIEDDFLAAKEEFDKIIQQYPLLIPNEEIDRTLTDLCISNGLKPTALRFTDSYGAPQVEVNDESINEDDASYLFTVVVATMNMTSDYDSLMSLIDDVEASEYINIVNLGYAVVNSSDEDDYANITMTFELTYTNP